MKSMCDVAERLKNIGRQEGFQAVSYTHLDVYKRQPYDIDDLLEAAEVFQQVCNQ